MTGKPTWYYGSELRECPTELRERRRMGLRDDFPNIVCLCGSTRFISEYNRQRKALTEAGHIVLAVEIVTTQAPEADPQRVDHALKARLDELHLRKIDLADEVLILNVGGYVGPSTANEITYALSKGKRVRFLEPHHVSTFPPMGKMA